MHVSGLLCHWVCLLSTCGYRRDSHARQQTGMKVAGKHSLGSVVQRNADNHVLDDWWS